MDLSAVHRWLESHHKANQEVTSEGAIITCWGGLNVWPNLRSRVHSLIRKVEDDVQDL
jgi:hypothetical protein